MLRHYYTATPLALRCPAGSGDFYVWQLNGDCTRSNCTNTHQPQPEPRRMTRPVEHLSSHTRAGPHLRPLGQPTRPDTPQSKCDSSQILLTSATSEKACQVIPRPSHLAQLMSSGEPISSSPRTSDHLVWSSSRPGGTASCRQSCRHSSRRTRGAESSGRRRSAPCSPACPSRPDRGP